MSGPIGAMDSALYTKLNVTPITSLLGGQSRIYKSTPPASPTLPYVVYEHNSGGDENETSTRSRNVVYIIKAVATSASGAEQIDEQIDAQLHNQSLTITGWDNFWLAREDDVAYAESDGAGGYHHHVGGTYRIRISKTT